MPQNTTRKISVAQEKRIQTTLPPIKCGLICPTLWTTYLVLGASVIHPVLRPVTLFPKNLRSNAPYIFELAERHKVGPVVSALVP